MVKTYYCGDLSDDTHYSDREIKRIQKKRGTNLLSLDGVWV
jgi:hypothetical protein